MTVLTFHAQPTSKCVENTMWIVSMGCSRCHFCVDWFWLSGPVFHSMESQSPAISTSPSLFAVLCAAAAVGHDKYAARVRVGGALRLSGSPTDAARDGCHLPVLHTRSPVGRQGGAPAVPWAAPHAPANACRQFDVFDAEPALLCAAVGGACVGEVVQPMEAEELTQHCPSCVEPHAILLGAAHANHRPASPLLVSSVEGTRLFGLAPTAQRGPV